MASQPIQGLTLRFPISRSLLILIPTLAQTSRETVEETYSWEAESRGLSPGVKSLSQELGAAGAQSSVLQGPGAGGAGPGPSASVSKL